MSVSRISGTGSESVTRSGGTEIIQIGSRTNAQSTPRTGTIDNSSTRTSTSSATRTGTSNIPITSSNNSIPAPTVPSNNGTTRTTEDPTRYLPHPVRTVDIIRGCTNPKSSNYNSKATVDDGSCIMTDLTTEGKLYVSVNSDPIGGSILVDDVDSGTDTPGSLIFNYKELLTTKIIGATRNDIKSSKRYRITSKIIGNPTGVSTIQYIIEKYTSTKWEVDSTINSNGGVAYASIDFPLSQRVAGSTIPRQSTIAYMVRFEIDVSANNIIRYKTSDGQSAFLKDGEGPNINVSNTVSGVVPWIQLEKVGITNFTHDIKYSIKDPDTNNVYQLTDDFRKELGGGTTYITVSVTKNVGPVNPGSGNNPNIPSTLPIAIIDNNNLEYNISSKGSLQIPYSTKNADSITYTIGNIRRTSSSSGTIVLTNTDFVNGVGQYNLLIQPISKINGSGDIVRIIINVVSKIYLPGPDITKINYPYNIKGADFKGYDEDFKISWQSINTDYIEVYVTKKSSEFALAKVSPMGALTLNVADVLQKANKTFNDSTDVISFDIIMIPYNTNGDVITSGKEEKVTIIFDKSDLKLKRNQVLYDLRMAFVNNFNEDILNSQTSKYLTHLCHFGGGDNKLISTWGIDTETFSVYETNPETSQRRKIESHNSLVLKLYEPLPNSIQPNQQLWISKCQSLPTIEQVILTDDEISSCIPLKPNMSLDVSDDIGYQILDDLIASGSVSSTELIQQYINNNEFSLSKLDIEYVSGSDYVWNNFIKYSSAKERVENFVYKIELLEFYDNRLTSLNTGSVSGSIATINEINRINETITGIKRGFDSFENYLYTVADPLSYPGAGLSHVSASSDSSVTSWYNGISTSAIKFDNDNKNSIINNIPKHFINDSNGNDFILFFNMIGQHFDIVWNYIHKFSQSKQLQHTNKNGMTDDLIYHMLESLGWDADMGVRSQFLWEYAFGIKKDGTPSSSMSGKDRQLEIWRRLLNNLPYLYKHKGTRRALNAAMSCYGVPSSMLTIMEFGGPDNPSTTGTKTFTFDDRTSSINMLDITNISIPWVNTTGNYPQSIEIRINTENRKTHRVLHGEEWELYIIPDTGSLAKVEFRITGSVPGGYESASTQPMPFFNDEYKQIVINKIDTGSFYRFDLYVKEGFNERIRNKGEAITYIPNSALSWNMGNDISIGTGFDGKVDEFRLWKTPLKESKIDNHTLLPDAIDGNSVSSSTEDLIFRLDFEYPKDRSSLGDPYIKNVSINQSYGYSSAIAWDFPTISSYPYNYTPYERSVTAIVPSTGISLGNKIRFESHTLDNFLNFGTTSNVSTFDDNKDTNKLGLFFSPTKEINMDILRSLGQFNIDNYIGNPDDFYNDGYTDLNELREYYFSRFDLNIYEYIQLVRYIDQTLFTTLKSLVPARAKVSSGLLIEPHILERSKVEHKRPFAENIGLTSKISVEDTVKLKLDYNVLESIIDAEKNVSMQVTNPQYESELLLLKDEKVDGDLNDINGFIVSEDIYTVDATNEGITTFIDAYFPPTVQGQYDSSKLTIVGMDPFDIANSGFGIWAKNSHTIRTYIDVFGNHQQDRKKIYKIKQKYTVNTPENINPNDPSVGTHMVNEIYYKYQITFLDFNQSAPIVSGDIVQVDTIDGYLPSHYKYVGDLPSGLEYSYYKGSKQTSKTTLDGTPAVETFSTNPNILRVNDGTDREGHEPILIVD